MTNDSSSQEESLRIHEFTSYHLSPVDVVKATCQYHAVVREEAPSHSDADLARLQREDPSAPELEVKSPELLLMLLLMLREIESPRVVLSSKTLVCFTGNDRVKIGQSASLFSHVC